MKTNWLPLSLPQDWLLAPSDAVNVEKMPDDFATRVSQTIRS